MANYKCLYYFIKEISDKKSTLETISTEIKLMNDIGLKNTIKWYLDNRDWWINIIDNTYQLERLGVIK